MALRLEYPEVLKVIDQPAKDTLRSQLKKVVHTLGLFYGQIETQALEKKRDEIPAKPNSGGPGKKIPFFFLFSFFFEKKYHNYYPPKIL